PATAAMYERIGRAYGIPMFVSLGAALQMVNERGLNSQQVLTRLARDTLEDRAAEARVVAAQTKTLIVVPMGLMIIPILVLLGAPILSGLTGLFAR
ncbi:MAG: type II secretion system F family protein, partial [Candidatus Dormibacteraeota bacterium]|nr:type II secretion system F family protein [Candidatus Dormibacteraeota bacterium]